jgi:succinyl-diaminopimelate desuccinylase
MAIDPTDPVALAQALIRCPSVTPVEGGALTFLESVLGPAGFTCHRLIMKEPGTPDVENLYARIGSTSPHLCFAGHTDVVPVGDEKAWTRPPFGAVIDNGVLYGRGAADMKGGIACFAAAAIDYLNEVGGLNRGSISFLITGDEEAIAINGTPKLLDWLKARNETIDACVVGEPASLKAIGDEIKIGRRGYMNAEVVVSGKQGHAAYPQNADNPVPKLARIIDRVCSKPLDAGTQHFEPTSVQPTIISVPNTATNVIPASARVNFNIRYNDLHTPASVEAWIRGHCETVAKELGAKFTIKLSGTGDVFLTKPGPLVNKMADAVRTVTGTAPRFTTTGGTSDARFIKNFCPVVEAGLRNATVHQVDEHVPVDDLLALTRIYHRFIADYFAV